MSRSLKHETWLPVRAWLTIAGLIGMLLAACGPATGGPVAAPTAAGMLGAVLDAGVMVVATDPNYAPQSLLIQGEPRAAGTRCAANQFSANQFTGLDVDVANEIARRLGVEACFVTPAWIQVISGSWSDRWDISIGSMVITPDRMERLYFAQPYTSGSAVLFVHRDNTTFREPADLSGRRIGACVGCAYEAYLKHTLEIPHVDIQFVIDNPHIVGYESDPAALRDLATGHDVRLDAVITDPDTGQEWIDKGLPIKQLDGALYYDLVAPAIDKKSSRNPLPWLEKLNDIVQQMHQDGTLSSLSIKYYGRDDTGPARAYDIEALKQEP